MLETGCRVEYCTHRNVPVQSTRAHLSFGSLKLARHVTAGLGDIDTCTLIVAWQSMNFVRLFIISAFQNAVLALNK